MRILLTRAAFIFLLAALPASAAVSVQYYNRDSKAYVWKVRIGGSTTTVEFGPNRSATTTIQGGSDSCVVETPHGPVTLRQGQEIEIKDGKITIQR